MGCGNLNLILLLDTYLQHLWSTAEQRGGKAEQNMSQVVSQARADQAICISELLSQVPTDSGMCHHSNLTELELLQSIRNGCLKPRSKHILRPF